MTKKRECFISVDVETAGPIPGEYSMLSLGACVVGADGEGFYAEIKPLNENAVPEALKVSGFDLAKLAKAGQRPEDALAKLREWVAAASAGAKPVFVGFNAGFDWSFETGTSTVSWARTRSTSRCWTSSPTTWG